MKKMNYIYTLDELRFNLPDYISGKINDEILRKSIEDELIINPDFRKEADGISSTFRFLEKTEFENPPESYFSNLSVRINKRIEQNPVHGMSIFEKIFSGRKILIPLIPAILLVLFLLFKFGNGENKFTFFDDNKNVNSSINKTKKIEPVENGNKTEKTAITQPDSLGQNLSEIKEESLKLEKVSKPVRKEISKNLINKNQNKKSETINNDLDKTETEINDNLFTDNTDEYFESEDTEEESDYLFDNDPEDDDDLEIEFHELNPGDQKEILDILNISKI